MLNDLPALVPTLQRLAKTDQLQDLLVTLHTYKGTVATLGLTDLSTQLAALEAQLKSGPGATELEQYLPVLTEVIGQGVQELHQALLQLDRAAQDRSIDTQSQLNGVQDLQPALQQLVALLEQDDMGALEVFSRLQSIFNQLPDADFDRLELALQNLELEQALYICKKLILA
jgi:chemotaxis protein histidine kinase CheA